jgi:hypothetical protein
LEVVNQAEESEERAEALIRGARLVEQEGQLKGALPIALGQGLLHLVLRLRRGRPVGLGLELGFESLSLLVRRAEPVRELHETALELGPRGRGVVACWGRLRLGGRQVPPQGFHGACLVCSGALHAVELGFQFGDLRGECFVALGERRLPIALLLDRSREPVDLGLVPGSLAGGGLGLLQEGGQAIPIRRRGFKLLACGIALADKGLDFVSEPFGLRAERGEIALELEACGLELRLRGQPLGLGLVPCLAGSGFEIEDLRAELRFPG